jgi:hypothetical protein
MALIDLRLSIDSDPGQPDPDVGAWIDLRPELGLDSEIELPLRRRGRQEWVGTFAVGKTQPGYFLYRVALAAHVGASWELAIRKRGAGTPLLCDADTFSLAKYWLVGSCDAPDGPTSVRLSARSDSVPTCSGFDPRRESQLGFRISTGRAALLGRRPREG